MSRRIESYVKYAELAYDLFHLGFDIFIIDHRGQGRSGRMLSDPHRGHVDHFNDYVEDLAAFWQQEIEPGPWRKRYIWRTQWGRDSHPVPATPSCAVRCYCAHRADVWYCDTLAFLYGAPYSRLGRGHQRIREDYAIGTGQWRALPFGMNALTHSRQRYQRNLRFYADEPQLRVGGPTALGTRRHSGG